MLKNFLFLSKVHLVLILDNEMPGNIATKVDSFDCHEIRGPNGVRKSRKGWSYSTDQSGAGGAPTTPVATNGDVVKPIISCEKS